MKFFIAITILFMSFNSIAQLNSDLEKAFQQKSMKGIDTLYESWYKYSCTISKEIFIQNSSDSLFTKTHDLMNNLIGSFGQGNKSFLSGYPLFNKKSPYAILQDTFCILISKNENIDTLKKVYNLPRIITYHSYSIAKILYIPACSQLFLSKKKYIIYQKNIDKILTSFIRYAYSLKLSSTDKEEEEVQKRFDYINKPTLGLHNFLEKFITPPKIEVIVFNSTFNKAIIYLQVATFSHHREIVVMKKIHNMWIREK